MELGVRPGFQCQKRCELAAHPEVPSPIDRVAGPAKDEELQRLIAERLEP